MMVFSVDMGGNLKRKNVSEVFPEGSVEGSESYGPQDG
jgi:hypothetical protein